MLLYLVAKTTVDTTNYLLLKVIDCNNKLTKLNNLSKHEWSYSLVVKNDNFPCLTRFSPIMFLVGTCFYLCFYFHFLSSTDIKPSAINKGCSQWGHDPPVKNLFILSNVQTISVIPLNIRCADIFGMVHIFLLVL